MVGRIGRRLAAGYGVLLFGALVAIGTLLVLDGVGSRPAAAQKSGSAQASTSLLTAQAVFAAFKASGLPADNPRQLAVGGGVSGAPATESASWSFSVPSVAPSGGHIMVFSSTDGLKKKSDWFGGHGAGYSVTSYRNIILWLDPRIGGKEASTYRQALRSVR